MLFNEKKYEFEIDGRKCSFSTGKLARKSHSAVFATMGETAVMVNAEVGKVDPNMDYFPMSVEYIEKLYAAGKISSSRFIKRERFPSDDAVLKARLIDRSFRSRFPGDYRNVLSLTITVLSFDPDNDPTVLAINAASAALMISKAPFGGPISGVRVSLKDGKPYSNYSNLEETTEEDVMNYMLSGDGNLFTMIDAGFHVVEESKVIEAMEYSQKSMNEWIEAQKEFAKLFDVEKEDYERFEPSEELMNQVKEFVGKEIDEIILDEEFYKKDEMQEKLREQYAGQFSKSIIDDAFEKLIKKTVRNMILNEGKRTDGRKMDEIREVAIETGVLPRVHGSGLFTRGMTQSLTIATLGNTRSMQMVDDMTGEESRAYMHFYNALPSSLGQADRIRWIPGRREVGHGALAEKALHPVVPSIEEFPYTQLLMSEILSQGGSSSMAATCASSLALMDAGVPVKAPVAGIAMGVVTDPEGAKFQVLTDIKDVEDFYGDMDFKVTGTREGVTAIQMDNKAAGLPLEIFKVALEEAKKARLFLLDEMQKVIEKPRDTVSKYAPKVDSVKIPVSKIGELIGPGGKNIRELSESTETEVTVEEDGTVYIFGETKESIEAVKERISGLSFVPEIGKVYKGIVVSIMEYGAFVEIAPNISGLVHVSELTNSFVKNVKDFVTEGQEVEVKLVGVKDDGKLQLSMKALESQTN